MPSIRTAYLSVWLGLCPGAAWADFWTDNQCTLDRPKPVFRNGKFRLDETTGVAAEAVPLGESVSLRLEQTACEYLTRTYTFTLKEVPADTDVVGWQYRKAIELLSLLEERSTPRLKFTGEKGALERYIELIAHPQEDVEIYIAKPRDQFYEIITVESRLRGDDGDIVVKIWSGPY